MRTLTHQLMKEQLSNTTITITVGKYQLAMVAIVLAMVQSRLLIQNQETSGSLSVQALTHGEKIFLYILPQTKMADLGEARFGLLVHTGLPAQRHLKILLLRLISKLIFGHIK